MIGVNPIGDRVGHDTPSTKPELALNNPKLPSTLNKQSVNRLVRSQAQLLPLTSKPSLTDGTSTRSRRPGRESRAELAVGGGLTDH